MCKWVQEIITCNLSCIQESGLAFQMNGTPKTIYGTMTIASAGNVASNALGGFKEGFTAFHHCRQCMGIAEECKQEVSDTPRAPSDMQLTVITKAGTD